MAKTTPAADIAAVAEERGAAGGVPPAGRVLVEAVHRVAAGAVGPQVLEAAEPLLEVAVEVAEHLALVVVGGHADRPQRDQQLDATAADSR